MSLTEAAFVKAALVDVDAVARALVDIDAHRTGNAVVDALLPSPLPNLFQLSLSVWRMHERLLMRNETVGLSAHPPRRNLRARLLQNRAVRLPFLLRFGSVKPLDLTGLRSSAQALRTHVIGTHHEGKQPVYDLEILAARSPAELSRLRDDVAAVIAGTHKDTAVLRDLCVYERYHEELLPLIDDAVANRFEATNDPDLGFFACLRWCARQPSTLDDLRAARAAGRFTLQHGLVDDDNAALTLDDLLGLDQRGLQRAFARGHKTSASTLHNRRCRGVSLGLPRLVERATWKLFAKDVVVDGDRVHGWNVGVDQPASLDASALMAAPLIERRRYAPFDVVDDDAGAVIDYNALMKDPLRQVGDNLLLGVTQIAGATTPTWFALMPESPIPRAAGLPTSAR